MLTLYRRHTKRCSRSRPIPLDSGELKRCSCPLWAIGIDDGGKHVRQSLSTRDLGNGREKLALLERGEQIAAPEPEVTIGDAFARARSILTTQKGLKSQSLEANQGSIERVVAEYAKAKGFRFLREFQQSDMDALIGEWTKLSPSTRRVRISVLRNFFSLAASRKWVRDDPTINIIMPRGSGGGQTKPFTPEEEGKILAALPDWETHKRTYKRESPWAAHPRTASALILVLRYTGLRVSDAFAFDPRSLEAREIDSQRVYCYYAPRQKKTEHPVFLPIPPVIAERIISAPRVTERYAFWDGSPVKRWNAGLAINFLTYLERASGVSNIHPHRFRDTFAVDLLTHGADIRSVSRLLGHKTVATTLQYYEHWMPSDQERLIRVAMGAWEH
jgi:integrase/recombinase XerD